MNARCKIHFCKHHICYFCMLFEEAITDMLIMMYGEIEPVITSLKLFC